MANDQCLQLLPPSEAPPDELAIRRQAIELVGEHWRELRGRIARWLGTAYREDDSLPGEVAFIMIRRYRNGNGRLVAFLRANSRSGAAETKQVLFGEAKLVSREVLPQAIENRTRSQNQVEWGLDHPAPMSTSDVEPDQLLGDIQRLLTVGARAWESLCGAGLLDPTSWTEDQKWTAIAMMWGFSVDEIAEIRFLKVHGTDATVPTRVATRQMMRTVRRKGKILLQTVPAGQLREYDLLDRAC